ncbi:MAG: MBL fold metallo-hydrolase [Desulfobacteraceae bacterium]|nr:MAG: MBL fold metallo-hydrolase [Desulfobacteraceae bacterium]
MVRKLVVGPYQTNCYIIGSKETGEGLVIDPGDEVSRIVNEIVRNALNIRMILITHGHFDHTGGVAELKKITKAPVMINNLDASGLEMPPDGFLTDGQELQVGSYRFRVLHTPGHSPGGVCFYTAGAVFTGDTLFAGSIGRTDHSGGDHPGLIAAVRRKIFPLGDDLRIYPGHGPSGTIGRERLTNPFFR